MGLYMWWVVGWKEDPQSRVQKVSAANKRMLFFAFTSMLAVRSPENSQDPTLSSYSRWEISGQHISACIHVSCTCSVMLVVHADTGVQACKSRIHSGVQDGCAPSLRV